MEATTLMKTAQRQRDESALRYAGFLGHTFFVVADDSRFEGMNQVRVESGSLVSAMKEKREGDRVYQKIGKGKFKLIAS